MGGTHRWRWWVLAGLVHVVILAVASVLMVQEPLHPGDDSAAITVSVQTGRPETLKQPLPSDNTQYLRELQAADHSEVAGNSAILFPEVGKNPGVHDTMGVGGGGGGAGGSHESASGDSKDHTSYIKGESGGFRGTYALRARSLAKRAGGGRVSFDETLILERINSPFATRAMARQESPRGSTLTARVANRVVPIPLKHTDVKAQVSIYLASVTVKQQYHNPYDSKIEAVYTFPLPDDAAVRDFIMVVGDRTIRGMIREKEEARRIYQEERARGRVASLMTQERDNVFTQSVANIEPGKQIDIDITYFHALNYERGEYEFHFPMVVGPRYNPADSTQGVGAVPRGEGGTSGQSTEIQYLPPNEITANDITLEVAIDAGLPIQKIESPSHIIRVERPAAERATVRLSPSDRIPNKDFVLRYRVGGKGIASALATHRDEKGGTFSLVIQPPDALEDIPATAREMFFVLDVSGSMRGAPIEISKRTMERCLRRLAPTDTFQIVTFAGSAATMSPRPLEATPENLRRAMAYVQSQQGAGGTEMLTGIRAALEAPRDPKRYRIVSFMTDGFIGNEVEIFGAVRQSIGDARIFAFGIGSSVNRFLIEGLGRIGRGTSEFVGLDESSERAVDGLYQRIEHPALTDIKFEWTGGEISDVYPSTIPDLLVGRPVVLTGKFRGVFASTLKITGRIAGREHVMTMTLDPRRASKFEALPAVWARNRIASLSDRMILEREGGDLAGEIRATAIEYGILSQFTAFVAVDSSRVTEGTAGTTVPVPVPVPAGVRYETTVPEKK